MKFRYNFEISNDFIMKINSQTLLIIKRIINLNVDINEEITISLLSVSNDRLIINFKSNAFKTTTFNEVLFKIKIKLLIFFSTIIIYLF